MTFGLHPLTGNVSETGTGHGDNCGLSVRSLGGVHCGRITHKVPCRRTSFRKALFRAYRQQLAILFSKSSFLLSEFGSAQTRSTLGSRGQRSMVCARSFHIKTWPRLPCTRAHQPQPHSPKEFTVVLFSGSLWLRREAQSSALCPVQIP